MDFNSSFSIQLVGWHLPAHRRVGSGTVLGCGDHVFALVSEDLEGFVEDRSQLWKDRATANPTAFVVLDLWLGDAHSVRRVFMKIGSILEDSIFCGIMISKLEEEYHESSINCGRRSTLAKNWGIDGSS